MDQLMQANLQIIELLGAVFEEVERQEMRASKPRPDKPAHLRTWVCRPRPDDDTVATSCANAMN